MTTTTGPDTAQYVIGADGELRVRLHSGELRLRGVEGDTVRVRDIEGHDLTERLVIEAAAGRLSIRPRERFMLDFGWAAAFAGFGRGIELAIDVPASASVSIDTASADVDSTATRGPQRYRTASGEIVLADVSGDINADAVSGDIAVRVSGQASVAGRTVSGELKVRDGAVRALELVTTSGDVEVDTSLVGDGPFSVQTVSGDASIATDRGLSVTAKTVTGDISADGARRSEGRGNHLITIGDGAVPFTFRSISGDLRITRKADSSLWQRTKATAAKATESTRATETPAAPEPDARSTERLAILRDLEAGTIDVDVASQRLAALDEAES